MNIHIRLFNPVRCFRAEEGAFLVEKHSQEILSVLNLEHQFNLPKMWCPTVAFYYMTT